MATSAAGPVTIDRAYFDTLVRRANFNRDEQTGGIALPDGPLDSSVLVQKDEYDNLRLVARQYANLKQQLINGGVPEHTIQLLSHDVEPPSAHVDVSSTPTPSSRPEGTDDGGARLNTATPSADFHSTTHQPYKPSAGNGHGSGVHRHGGFGNRHVEKTLDWAELDDSPTYSLEPAAPEFTPAPEFHAESQGGAQHTGHIQGGQRPQYARMCKRTVTLIGLPETVTPWDVTEAVRGGLVLDLFLRTAERMALVSFLREDDAVRFYEYARTGDLFIKNKRVFIRWAERQFHLPGHVASKVAIGATRNLVVRRCDPRLSEDSIRDDLEHIHNLIVIKVHFRGSSCYIKTNSVHNAMYAKTCMQSRLKYKGSKIEWDVDECTQPLEVARKRAPSPQPQPQPHQPQLQRAAPPKKGLGLQNRFDMLRMDDDDNDESDDKFDTSSEMPGTVNVTA
ncbi:hypothetical protein F4780DRAFT_777025 [Xylariomycetidae sp. FL0641]|nr:hypothetical protein F4780DRAFT_777025 [Xylariomycetidae sp. FL0641]